MTCSFSTYLSTYKVEEYMPRVWGKMPKAKTSYIAIPVLLLPSDLIYRFTYARPYEVCSQKFSVRNTCRADA